MFLPPTSVQLTILPEYIPLICSVDRFETEFLLLTKKTNASFPIGVKLNLTPLSAAIAICSLDGAAQKIISTFPFINDLYAPLVVLLLTIGLTVIISPVSLRLYLILKLYSFCGYTA